MGSIVTNVLNSFTEISEKGDKKAFEEKVKEHMNDPSIHMNILKEVMTVPGKFGEILKGMGSVFGNMKKAHEAEVQKKKEEDEKLAQQKKEEEEKNLEESVFTKSEEEKPLNVEPKEEQKPELTDLHKFKITQLLELGFNPHTVKIVVEANPDMSLEELVELVISY